MAGAVQGALPGNQPIQAAAQQTATQVVQEGFTALQDLINTTDELSTLAGAMKNVKEGAAKEGQESSQLLTQQAGRPDFSSAAASAAASEELDKLEKKKKLKEKKLKEKLAMLLKFAESLDLNSLEPEEREAMEEFMQLAKSIQHTETKLKRLDQQQLFYEDLVEKKRQKR